MSSSWASSLTPVAHAEDVLQLYAALDYSTDVAKAFTAKTGIPVNVTALSTGPLLAKITAEKNNPQWGVYWADGAEPCAAFDLEKQLLHYQPKGARLALFGLGLCIFALMPTEIGYQDIASLLARQPGVAERWQKRVFASDAFAFARARQRIGDPRRRRGMRAASENRRHS